MTPNAEPYRGFFVHPADSKHLLSLKFNFAPIIPQRGCKVKGFFQKTHFILNRGSFYGRKGFKRGEKGLLPRERGFQRGAFCASAKIISTKTQPRAPKCAN